ncbi:MAG TPA: phosphomannomutase/phosphoglucomutase [Acidimicrobiales bacterium]|nr:phosphomannomutase/phosphoglucomutase [Acidimicrobiales bacterium]
MTSLSNVFKAYDIRGVVPDDINALQFRAIGVAVARFTGAPTVLVARDMRESGAELAGAFADGVRSEGAGVIDLGLASTDLLYFAAGSLDAPGAMFTASHNPARYNGLKLCQAGARPIGRDTGLAEIQATAESLLDEWSVNGPPVLDPGRMAPIEERSVLDAYADHVRSFVDVDALRPLRVVADTANGMGGLVAPKVFEGLPFEVEMLFPELDGNFPNHPADPIQPENLVDLQRVVLDTGADIGLAFDGDADRVFLVDEHAEPVSGSLTTALVASSLLDKHPGSTVLYNCICSRVVPEVIAEKGGVGIRTRVGHSYIKEVMAETGAVFGGEHSGHYYFRENYRADSGIIAAMLVLELLSVTGKPLSELLAPFKRYAASGEINTVVADPAGAVELMAAEVEAAGGSLGTADRLDGLTVDRGDWWYNLRPSNTEPLLRLNVEAPDEESCARHVAEVEGAMARLLNT